jgi:hypothetical protein
MVFPHPSFFFRTPDGNNESTFHCILSPFSKCHSLMFVLNCKFGQRSVVCAGWSQATHSECFGLCAQLSTPIILNRFPDSFTCGQNWPLYSPDLNTCDYFLWGFLKEDFSEKAADNNGIKSTNHSGLQRDN